jgi:hypothetical protein
MFGGSTPDITPAQVTGLVASVLALLIAFGVSLTEVQTAAILGFTGIVVGLLLGADAAIRRGRARVREAEIVTAAPLIEDPLVRDPLDH